MPYIHHADNGRILNEFMDRLSEFKQTFVNDGRAYRTVAAHIVDALSANWHLETENPNHPFAMYATDDEVANFRNLSNVIRPLCANNAEERGVVVSFFHSGGANHEDLEELLDDFSDFADCINHPEEDGDDEDDDDNSEDDQVLAHPENDRQERAELRVPRLQGGPFGRNIEAF
jgi:hypothetical protein